MLLRKHLCLCLTILNEDVNITWKQMIDYQGSYKTRGLAIKYRLQSLLNIKDVAVVHKKSPCLLPFLRLLGPWMYTLYLWHLVSSAGCQVISSGIAFAYPFSVPIRKTLFASLSVLPPSSVCLVPSSVVVCPQVCVLCPQVCVLHPQVCVLCPQVRRATDLAEAWESAPAEECCIFG